MSLTLSRADESRPVEGWGPGSLRRPWELCHSSHQPGPVRQALWTSPFSMKKLRLSVLKKLAQRPQVSWLLWGLVLPAPWDTQQIFLMPSVSDSRD